MSTNPRESGESNVPDLPELATESVSSEDEANVKGGGASAYLREAEKPLNRVIAPATPTNVTLSFDEGDSLFKR